MLIFKELIYQGIQQGQLPARTAASRQWYREAAKQVDGVVTMTQSKVFRQFGEDRRKRRMKLGRMYMFKYDPKMKQDLPYYDTFPLILPIEMYPDGYLGINFHYLPHVLRAKLMDALYSISNNKKFDEKTKIVATYQVLKSATKYKAFKPTVKKYLNTHVRSLFYEVTAPEWDIALFLPLERFKKSGKAQVWADSRKKI